MRVHSLILSISFTLLASSEATAQMISTPAGVTRSLRTFETSSSTDVAADVFKSTPLSYACDNSGIQAVEARKKMGKNLLWGGAAVAWGGAYLLSQANASGGSAAIAVLPVALGSVAMIAGGRMRGSQVEPEATETAVRSLVVGSSSAADVRSCLGTPISTMSRGLDEQIWTYTGGSRGEVRAVMLTIKNGVLSNVARTGPVF